ncbi:MAG TPA: ribbon-helix-helix protein, CopG family [Pyrodictiaceae archaeon]|nr:ribbon-helix-helix protein, CopG family [Pyrodictiaceae archaeon]HIQ55705.1 ribbon-helix-helix protein, CopG family [Pyrodictium sp.]
MKTAIWITVELSDEIVELLERLVDSGHFSSISEALNFILKTYLCKPSDTKCWMSKTN